MEGNTSNEKDNIITKVVEVCGDITLEHSSTLEEIIETDDGTVQKVEYTKQSEILDKSEMEAEESEIVDESANSLAAIEEAEEQWDLKKIMTMAAVTRKSPIKCSHDTCTLVAATIWVSNLKPSENWYSCLDCQELDFDGWPDLHELPLQYMTQEHKEALIAKCSKYKDCHIPVFEKSPTKDVTAVPSSISTNAITPLPNTGNTDTQQEKPSSIHITISPDHTETELEPRNLVSKNTMAGTKLSKSQLEIHRKWQAAAEEAGGPNARIVLQKPVAKKMIFDFLFDVFRPMNITEIYKGLKAQIPSPILKMCLDDMALDNDSSNQFADTDDEGEDDAPSKKKSCNKKEAPMDNENQFKNTLSFKGGKGSNSSLYYVNYNNTKGGEGLDPEDKNQLITDSATAEAKITMVKSTLSSVRSTVDKLLSEPMNTELNNLITKAEEESNDLLGKLDVARTLKVNEQHIKQTKKKIEYFSAFWRKRRKLCMDFLITMEELTDGTVSMKKCLAGDGPIDIDCDEACAKLATETGKNKMNRFVPERGGGKDSTSANKNITSKPGLQSFNAFVAVLLDSQGKVQRVHIGNGGGSK